MRTQIQLFHQSSIYNSEMISQTLTSVPISQREIWELREEDAAERWELGEDDDAERDVLLRGCGERWELMREDDAKTNEEPREDDVERDEELGGCGKR